MSYFEITFDEVPEGQQTNRFLLHIATIFNVAKWARTMGVEFKIQKTENAPHGIKYGEVIDLEMELPKKKYLYYCIEASKSEELTDRFLVRVEEDKNSYKYVKRLIENALNISDWKIKMATVEDIVSNLYFDGEIAELCSATELKRGKE